MVEKASKRIALPNYIKMYRDLIEKKFPERLNEFKVTLDKENLTSLEVIELNDLLFGKKSKEQEVHEHKYRAYDKQTILRIIRYQRQHQLNDKDLALHFKLSRNTIARWKRIFRNYINVL